MKIFVLAFFIFCLGFSIIESINLNCQFKTQSWNVLGNVDYCDAVNQHNFITNRLNRQINTIDGSAIANPSVKLVYIRSSNCFYFPFGLEKCFPNLEGIIINHSKLKEIRRDDLKDYKNLTRLDLESNEIEFLDPNLFEFVPKLEGIWLNKNKIAHIDANVLNNFVGKLNYLLLSYNICQFEDAENDKSKANQIIAKVQSGSCFDGSIMQLYALKTLIEELNKKLEAEKKESTDLQVRLMQEVKAIGDKVNGQNQELAAIKDKLEASEASSKLRVQKLSEQNLEIKAELKEAQKKLESNQNVIKSDILEIKSQRGTCAVDQLENRVKFIETTIGINSEHHRP